MAFETITPGIDETSRYWEPLTVGDQIEGNVIDFVEDNYGNTRILLELESGFEKELPSHRDLQRYNRKVDIGDYIRVTLAKIIPSNNENYADKRVYKVEKDPSRKVEYEEEEADEYDY